MATALLRAGEPLDVVQALLGHADPRTTQANLHVDQLERSPPTAPNGAWPPSWHAASTPAPNAGIPSRRQRPAT